MDLKLLAEHIAGQAIVVRDVGNGTYAPAIQGSGIRLSFVGGRAQADLDAAAIRSAIARVAESVLRREFGSATSSEAFDDTLENAPNQFGVCTSKRGF